MIDWRNKGRRYLQASQDQQRSTIRAGKTFKLYVFAQSLRTQIMLLGRDVQDKLKSCSDPIVKCVKWLALFGTDIVKPRSSMVQKEYCKQWILEQHQHVKKCHKISPQCSFFRSSYQSQSGYRCCYQAQCLPCTRFLPPCPVLQVYLCAVRSPSGCLHVISKGNRYYIDTIYT